MTPLIFLSANLGTSNDLASNYICYSHLDEIGTPIYTNSVTSSNILPASINFCNIFELLHITCGQRYIVGVAYNLMVDSISEF